MIDKRYVTVKKYAELCDVGVHAIYARLEKSDRDIYKEGDEGYLEQTELKEAEGVFIDTKKFPPAKMHRGRKHKSA